MLHPRTYEGRPLWGRAVYTALHGARLSSVPSGDQSANPASVQGAAVSSERFSQSLPPRNVAELGGSPPLRGSLEQLDRPSPAGPPLQGTELAALSTPETSLERLVPLVDYSAAWAAKCVSMGHAHCRQGYVALCRSLSTGEQALVMEQEVSTLLREETIEVVPALDIESRFYSRTSCSGERGCVRLRSKLTEPLSHTTEVQKALFKHVSLTRSEDWWSRAI